MGGLTVRPWLAALGAIFERDARIYMSYRTQPLTRLLALTFNLLLFFYLSKLVRVGDFTDPGAYFAFVTVGLVILQVLSSTLGSGPNRVRGELLVGTFERVIVSPFGAVSGVVATLFFPLAEAVAAGTAMVLVATLLFGLPLQATAPLAIPVAALGAMAFLPFAVAFASLVVIFKRATTGSQFVIAFMAIVGGLYFPIELLPDWIEWASHVQPFTPAADLLRHLLVDSPLRESAWLSLAKLAGFAVALLPIAVWILGRAVRYGQRRGTIIEY